MSKGAQSRAGQEGNMTTATMATTGFGVFAYYTEGDTYGQFRRSTYTAEPAGSATGAKQINFMYNQKVTSTDPYTTWTYEPLKYWPNGNATADNIGATGTPGGNVSFFAYAPYVTKTAADDDASTGTGIIGMTANNVDSDPILTYKLNPNNGVDLLWGTLNTADNTVNNAAQAGVSYDNAAAANTYKKSILPHETSGTYDGYRLAADLTKQKISGKIDFLFKHALASLGGGSGVSIGGGFQVVLDVDAVNGGSREQFDVDDSGSNDDWRTIVTIKDIKITNDLDNSTTINGEEVGQANQGTFNLATGIWKATADQVVGQTIGTNIGDATTYNAVLNEKIAEKYDNSGSSQTWLEHAGSTAAYFNKTYSAVNDGTHPGVTETAQNVYKESTQSPLMFIPIPGATAPKFKITVDYIVRTYDTNLVAGYSEVEQVISKTVTFPSAFELNKHYNLIMHLGLTSVRFTASVENWDEGHIGTAGGGSGADSDIIYLPINVE